MPIDAATLHDLDVLTTSTPRGPTLFALVDRTRTRVGRDSLRRALAEPASSADRVIDLQRAHRALAADANAYLLLFDRASPDAVERYLRSNWQLPSHWSSLARSVRSAFRPRWFRDYLREMSAAQVRVIALLRAAAELAERLSATDSVVLRERGESLCAELELPEIRSLLVLGERTSASGRVRFDQLARDIAKPILTGVLRAIGDLEAMWSLGVATAEHRWSYPRPSDRLRVAGLVHPFLDGRCVANDLALGRDVRVCFVTGPNMAGKSTFLKAMGLAVLLAHAGSGVPASDMDCPIVGTIFSSVQISDNLAAGESFYLAEVRRVRSLALALRAGTSGFAVLDEPFRGTNVHDAAEATLAVISRLMAHPAALVFVASHLAEIAATIAGDPRVRLLHFAAALGDDRPVFDYHLRAGLSSQRLGMVLLKQEGVLDLLDGRPDRDGD